MSVVAVVPARGGSQEVPRKNLLRFAGFSLVQRAVLAARKAGIDRVLLSTDSPEIAADGAAVGAEVPGLRPGELATGTARTADAVRHVLGAAAATQDIVIVLQPTSPMRRSIDIVNALALLQDRAEADAVMSIVKSVHTHPQKMRHMNDGWLTPIDPTAPIEAARQTLRGVYQMNGAIFGVRRAALDRTGTVMPPACLGYLMPHDLSLNIDSKWDVVLLEALLQRGLVTLETFDGLVAA